MNYPLFIVVAKEMVSMESKGQQWATLAASLLISLQPGDLFHVFRVFPPPCILTKGSYIVYFRWIHIRRAEGRGKMDHDRESGTHHTTKSLGRVVPPKILLVRFHVYFFCYFVVFPWKNGAPKNWLCLTLGRFLKLKNMQKQRLMFYRAKTKMNGILCKIPKNNVK
jgi:hypothetical protein